MVIVSTRGTRRKNDLIWEMNLSDTLMLESKVIQAILATETPQNKKPWLTPKAFLFSRVDWIRTCDPYVPNVVPR